MRSPSGTWLCADDLARRRLLDMERHLKPARTAFFGLLAVALAVVGPWIGWWPLASLVSCAAGFVLADRATARSARPEYWMAGAWAFSQLVLGATIVASGGATSALLPWMAIGVTTLSARFATRGLVLGVLWTTLITVAAALGRNAHAVADDPTALVMALATIFSVALLTTALMRSELLHRTEAAVDTLTGLFNRHALERRAPELVEQAQLTGAPIAVIVGDVDHFKRINDEHGHAAGDDVLRAVAEVLNETVRSFDLVYRYGGEEFVVLLPGTDVDDAVAVAERLRAAVADARPAGLELTMSFGVASSGRAGVEFDRLFRAADDLLYEAKVNGRNRVAAKPALVAAA
jgi:diguanylate cyclase (GGDEF)-like protein